MHDLQNKTVLITRPREKALEMARLVKDMNGEPVICPTIEIRPPEQWDKVDHAVQELHRYDWVIFSSAQGVKYFLQRVNHYSKNSQLNNIKIAAVGIKTGKSLEKRGIQVDLIPDSYTAGNLLGKFATIDVQNSRILHVTGDKGKTTLPDGLSESGATVDTVVCYRNVPPDTQSLDELKTAIMQDNIDFYTFTSPSTFQNFMQLLGQIVIQPVKTMNLKNIVAIGPVTAESIRSYGIEKVIISTESTIEGMLHSISTYLTPDKSNISSINS